MIKQGDIVRCSTFHYMYDKYKDLLFYVVKSQYYHGKRLFIDYIMYDDIDNYLNNLQVKIRRDYAINYISAKELLRKKKLNKLLKCG